MEKQHEPTASDIVIERYAIENANLKIQIAQLQIELNKLQREEEENVKPIQKD